MPALPQVRRFINVSTDEVYGESSLGKEEGLNEGSPLEPTNPYSAAKVGAGACSLHAAHLQEAAAFGIAAISFAAPARHALSWMPARTACPFDCCMPNPPHFCCLPVQAGAEMMARAYHTSYKLPVIVTRGNNVYGPHQFPEKMM